MINYITGYEWRLNSKSKQYLGFALLKLYGLFGRSSPFAVHLIGKWVPVIDEEKFRAAMDEVLTGYASAVIEQMNQESSLMNAFDIKGAV